MALTWASSHSNLSGDTVLKRAHLLSLGLLLPILFTACQKTNPPVAVFDPLANPAAVTTEKLLAADSSTQSLSYNGGYSEQRFSPLKTINTTNVGQLGLAWFADYDTNLDQHGSPLYIDGVIYVSTTWNKMYAYEAKTGKQLWQYNARVPGEWLRNVCCGNVNRGLAAYNGKIYMGTLDARLVAIDAKTGKEAWSTNTIIGDRQDPLNRFSITMAPRIVKGKVVIGASGGEFGVRGWIGAFDTQTGVEAWRFYTVPGDPAKGFENEAMKTAAATWSGTRGQSAATAITSALNERLRVICWQMKRRAWVGARADSGQGRGRTDSASVGRHLRHRRGSWSPGSPGTACRRQIRAYRQLG
jgi:glucose dehydrogenase